MDASFALGISIRSINNRWSVHLTSWNIFFCCFYTSFNRTCPYWAFFFNKHFSVLPRLFMPPIRMPTFRIFRQVTHNFIVIVKFFTHPKHNFTHSGQTDEWLGRTLSYFHSFTTILSVKYFCCSVKYFSCTEYYALPLIMHLIFTLSNQWSVQLWGVFLWENSMSISLIELTHWPLGNLNEILDM